MGRSWVATGRSQPHRRHAVWVGGKRLGRMAPCRCPGALRAPSCCSLKKPWVCFPDSLAARPGQLAIVLPSGRGGKREIPRAEPSPQPSPLPFSPSSLALWSSKDREPGTVAVTCLAIVRKMLEVELPPLAERPPGILTLTMWLPEPVFLLDRCHWHSERVRLSDLPKGPMGPPSR